MILSTRNRTELYGVLPTDADGMAASDEPSRWLAAHHDIDINQLSPRYTVATGLRGVAFGASGGRTQLMVLGEPQIFGQMKSALPSLKRREQWFPFEPDLPGSVQNCEEGCTDTAIGENPVS